MQTFITNNYRYIFGILVAIIVALAFYSGMIYGKDTRGDSVVLSCSKDVLEKLKIPTNDISSRKESVKQGEIFGSKNGTKYYTKGCTAGDRIKSENIIWFDNVENATLQGYSPANC